MFDPDLHSFLPVPRFVKTFQKIHPIFLHKMDILDTWLLALNDTVQFTTISLRMH